MPPSPPSATLITLSDGVDVLEALAEATSGREVWLHGAGQLQDVELRVAGEGADPRKRFRGRFVVASLSGPAGGPFGVVLARDSGGAGEVVAGQLVGGRSAGLTVLVVPIGTAATQPSPVAPEAELPSRSAAPVAEPATSSWARSAAATAALTRLAQPQPEEQPYPEAGDLVHHFAFGLCDVLIDNGESLKIRDRNGPGRIREIRLDKLRVLPPTDRDGKRLFKLERKL